MHEGELGRQDRVVHAPRVAVADLGFLKVSGYNFYIIK